MTIRCDDIRETLSAFLDGEERHAEAGIARAHLESCAVCRRMVEDWRAIEAALPSSEPAPPVTEAMIRGRAPRRRRVPVAVFAAAFMMVAATGSVLVASVADPAPSPSAPVALDDEASLPDAAVVPVPEESASPHPQRTVDPSPTSEPTASPSERPTTFTPNTTRGSNGQLVLMLTLERSVAMPGETVKAEVMLRNVTDHEVRFRSPSRSPIDLVIRDRAGDEVYRRSMAEGWEREMVERVLAPGETMRETIAFQAPEPGGYLVVAQCLCFPPEDASDPPTIQDHLDRDGDKTGPFETQPLKFASVQPRD